MSLQILRKSKNIIKFASFCWKVIGQTVQERQTGTEQIISIIRET